MVGDNFAKSLGKKSFVYILDGTVHIFLGSGNPSLGISFTRVG
jgi:hypothetical protein